MPYLVKHGWRERAAGVNILHEPGDVIDPVAVEEIPRLVACGALVDVADIPAPPAPVAEPVVSTVRVEEPPVPPTTDDAPKRPRHTAPEQEWRDYAESLGIDVSKLKGRDKVRSAALSAEK